MDKKAWDVIERRIEALETRVASMAERMDNPPDCIVSEWLESTERTAFKVLVEQIEAAVPAFSARAFRERLLSVVVAELDSLHTGAETEAQAGVRRTLRAFLEPRIEEIITDLLPPSVHDPEPHGSRRHEP